MELLDDSGKKVDASHGPFPILGEHAPHEKDLCLTSQQPGFSFLNLRSGEYVLRWVNEAGAAYRIHVVRVGMKRVSFVVN